MQSVQLYHEADMTSIVSILKNGLHYGDQGKFAQEPYARQTNELLDQLCPAKFLCEGVSRQKCLYAYLVLHGWIMDIHTGKPMRPATWKPADGNTKLAIHIDPATAYVGDLVLYDELAAAVQANASAQKQRKLAHQYWQRLVPLSDVLTNYQLGPHGIIASTMARADLPRRFARVEVLITASVPNNCVKKL